MYRAQGWRWMAVGLFVAAASGSRVAAQNAPTAPPPAPAVPQASAEGPAAGPATPADAPQPGCSCGDRHGFARWRWHRAHCKRHLQDTFIGYPEEFNEWPLGYALYAHGRTQVANAEAARMVFNHYDFVDGTSRLNVRGKDKLIKLGKYLPISFAPVVVERTPKEPGLDESRRTALASTLAQGPFRVPDQRVVIGPPLADGISGVESILIYGNQLSGIASGGALGGGVTGVGSFVGGGLGFTGAGLSGAAVTAVPR
jgi:hypothetical protein